MSPRTLFISDLHLELQRPDITRTFEQFLTDNRGRCDALYILGDLFEVWIGDDAPSPLADSVASALQQFGAAGAGVYLMHGNRDFLLGAEFARRCGANLVQELTVADLPSGPAVLLHGDTLCTDDVDYQQFRQLVRAPEWQTDFLAKPLSERQAFADQARQQSKSATADKAMTIMDVNQSAVLQVLRDIGQVTMIHGHTHRPAIHPISFEPGINGCDQGKRVVLGSWEDQAWFAESTKAGIHLHSLPLQ